jgi:hypothetical protein
MIIQEATNRCGKNKLKLGKSPEVTKLLLPAIFGQRGLQSQIKLTLQGKLLVVVQLSGPACAEQVSTIIIINI